MPTFKYVALDLTGNLVKDSGEFKDLDELIQTLSQQGLTLVRYSRPLFDTSLIKRRPPIKRKMLAEVLRNISLLISGGVPLRQALEDIYKSHNHPTVKWLLKEITKSLDRGSLLSEAVKEHRRYFSNIIITLIMIGEETGNLDKTLEDAAAHLDRIDEIISNTKSAMLYPSFVFFAMIGALTFWMLYVLPKILELIQTLGLKEVPFATRLLMVSVEFFQNSWLYMLSFLVLLVILYFITSRRENIKYYWDLFFTNLPIIGTALKSSQLAFFFEYSSLMTNAGINIVRTLELMEESIRYQLLKRGIRSIRNDISLGNSLYDSFKKVKLFEPFILRMISVGEQTGNLPSQFKILADYYMKIVNNLVNTISKIIEPIMLAFAGILFAIIALGLLGPIYEIMTKIQ